MNKKKAKINIIFIIMIILLVVTFLMIKFEFNPISYLLNMGEEDKVTETSVSNYNGIYRYKESLNKSYKLYSNCTLSYYDYYIVILNENFYRYKSNCVGTFKIAEGKTRMLKFSETVEKNTVITLEGKEYLKTDYINSVVEGNYFKDTVDDNSRLYADTYHVLLKEAQLPGREFNLKDASLTFSNVNFPFTFKVMEDKSFDLKLFGSNDSIIYNYKVKNLDDLPLFLGFGQNLTVIEPIADAFKYSYTFKAYTRDGMSYDLKTKFPITIDGDTLYYTDNIYIKYSPSENVFVMLVGDKREFCENKSHSKDVAYYVFHIKYDYVKKNFNNPKFIKKVYKNEGCSFVKELMEA